MKYVLHADDDEADRWDLKYLINSMHPDAEVINFTNGLELIRCVESMDEDALSNAIVFLDVQMPIWDGIRTLKALQASPSSNFVPVYMWSTAESKSEMGLCIREGARDFLVKPTQPEEWDEAKDKLRRALLNNIHL